MPKKTILLIEDDHKTETAVREALRAEYKIDAVKESRAARAYLDEKKPNLVIIDFDLKGQDGLQVYKDLAPSGKVIMLSISGSIPLAVSAAKLGVAEFLRKPINAAQLKEAVSRNISILEMKLQWVKGMEWLRGESRKVKELFAKIQKALREGKDMILVGDRGIPKESLAEFIHQNGPKKGRNLASIDLASFSRESLETYFWATVQKLMSLPDPASIRSEENLCGTIYLENLENLDHQFASTIFNFFRERKGREDRNIRALLGIYDKNSIRGIKIDEYALIEIPALRERKEDLPYLLDLYLKRSSAKYNKQVSFISSELLDPLASYDYPGNYLELEKMIEGAVLSSASNSLELKNFPFVFKELVQSSLKKGISEKLTLDEAKKNLEKNLCRILLEKVNQDNSAAARFLDVPKAVLGSRLESHID